MNHVTHCTESPKTEEELVPQIPLVTDKWKIKISSVFGKSKRQIRIKNWISADIGKVGQGGDKQGLRKEVGLGV